MNRERFKTVLLVGLITLSIFLANQIWIVLPHGFPISFGSDLKEERDNYILSDVVRPEKYMVNLKKEIHTILYSESKLRLWEDGRNILSNVFNGQKLKFEKIEDDDLKRYRNNKSIDLYFPEDVHLYILSKMIDREIPSDISDNIEYFNNIHISLGKDAFVVFSDGQTNLRLSAGDVDVSHMRKDLSYIEDAIASGEDKYTIYAPMSYLFPFDNDVYLPADLKGSLPYLELEKEVFVGDEGGRKTDIIAEEFFKRNLDYVKKIVENNNRSVIYIYNEKVLKFYNDGRIEYFNSLDETVSYRKLYTSLNRAIEFISNHMGWPEGGYLQSIDHIEWQGNLGYRFKFTYKIGETKTILNNIDNNLEAPIEIEVFNDQVKSYKRYVHKTSSAMPITSLNDKKMLSPINILQIKENYRPIENRYMISRGLTEKDAKDMDLESKILLSIKDIYLAYYNDYRDSYGIDRLIPVWVMEIDDRTYVFNGYTGELVPWGDY